MELVGCGGHKAKWEVVRYHIVAEKKKNGQMGLRGYDFTLFEIFKDEVNKGFRGFLVC